MNILNKYTLKNLKKNRVRTAVTIIGIVLSVAMITAVTGTISSLKNYMLDYTKATQGSWYIEYSDVSSSDIKDINNNDAVSDTTSVELIGYSPIENPWNEYKPYMFIEGIENDYTELLPVKLTSGRMPENSGEIILPNHLEDDAGAVYEIGESLNLAVGERTFEGNELDQSIPYISVDSSENGKGEEFVLTENRSYTVVGFYDRPYYEDYSAPGYTCLTVTDNDSSNRYSCFLTLDDIDGVSDFLDNNFTEFKSETNNDLLRFSGHAVEDSFNSVLYSMAGILIAIIVLGSISLIYNSFAISVSERTKQFGLLSSIGATKKQLMRSVLFEAFSLCLIAIPLGVVTGYGGMYITFKAIEGLFGNILTTETGIPLVFHLSVIAVLAAVAIGLITVFISALIPAIRSVRITAIDAIRQTSDIKIKPGKVKTSRLTYKLFGFEGMIASKNFKRNKKKYRATVISLFLSIVLFVSACSFVAYMKKGTMGVFNDSMYDIEIYSGDYKSIESAPETFSALSTAKCLTDGTYSAICYDDLIVNEEDINKEFYDEVICDSNDYFYGDLTESDGSFIFQSSSIYFVEDDYYRDYLESIGLDADKFMSAEKPLAVAVDYFNVPGGDGKFHTYNTLAKDNTEISYRLIKEIEGWNYSYYSENESGNNIYNYVDESGKYMEVSEDEATELCSLAIGAHTTERPKCADSSHIGLTLLYPYSAYNTVFPMEDDKYDDNFEVCTFTFSSSNHTVSAEDLDAIAGKLGTKMSVYDKAKSEESNRTLLAIIDIFSYGFIILISLIATANVFNTISTNISLRRREFAMLKSVGMTRRGFNKMMNYECILYGVKGLIFGLPVAVLITYAIFRAMNIGITMSFFIPWYAIAISVGSVFLIVFSTMIYSMSKIKKDNPIDALKNENL